jgi:hypothetical protein
MSEAIDLTLPFDSLRGLEREVRRPRMPLDHPAGALPVRLNSAEARLGVLEQSVHDLANEAARGFAQVQQQLARHVKRFDTRDAGLASPHATLAASTQRIMRAMGRDA